MKHRSSPFIMSGFGLVSEQTSLREAGAWVEFPPNDVNRLAYYLHSITCSLGIDIIKDELVDFWNVHRLPRKRQDAVFELAVGDFRPDNFIGKLIFHDEKGELCNGSINEFYEITKVQSILAVQSSVLIGGKRQQVAKIMVFHRMWLEQNYIEPVMRNRDRVRILTKSQRRGPDVGDVLAELMVGLLVEAAKGEESSASHCSHCRGLDGKCACKHGCPPGPKSKCYPVHDGVMCDGCRQDGIRGKRFQCTVCHDFDLCEKCYNEGGKRHDLTHSFRRIDRVGSQPVALAPRREPPRPQQHKQPSPKIITEPVPFAQATRLSSSPSSGTSSFNVGEKVELVGLQAAHMNGAIGVVEQNALMGGRVQVRLETKQPGVLSTIKPENLKKVVDFKPGQLVILVGLQSRDMNGCQAVIESCNPGGRVLVRLYGDTVVTVKPENIEMLADTLD